LEDGLANRQLKLTEHGASKPKKLQPGLVVFVNKHPKNEPILAGPRPTKGWMSETMGIQPVANWLQLSSKSFVLGGRRHKAQQRCNL